LGGTAIKPVGWDRTGLEAFKYFLYNPDTGEVLTRTPLSWVKITVFYSVYYFCLAAFWIGCLQVFFLTLPEIQDGPKWTMYQSIIGTNPGMGVRPGNSDQRIDSQMFVLSQGEREGEEPSNYWGDGDRNIDYAVRTRHFLESYNMEATYPYKNFDISELGPCGEYPYGFVANYGESVAPCIFLKLNKIWGWVPERLAYYDTDWIPEDLQDHYNYMRDDGNTQNVWMHCEGRNAADKEALGDIEYFPRSRGLPVEFFPFMGASVSGKNYHSPLVAIKIHPGREFLGQLIHVECRAYFRGVVHDTKNKMGLVQFEVLINE
jgi:sodium/potassium-transporting ATPase subunit beta